MGQPTGFSNQIQMTPIDSENFHGIDSTFLLAPRQQKNGLKLLKISDPDPFAD